MESSLDVTRVAVPAISFAQVPQLVDRLMGRYPGSKVNIECVPRHHSEQEVIAYLRGFDAAIVSFEPITDHVLASLPELKVVSKLGVGLDTIDPVAMKKHGVRLGWMPGVNKRSVAELALCLTIAGLRHVVASNVAMRNGERPLQRLGRQLTGRAVGVHGCGDIGKELVRLLAPFRCQLFSCDIREYDDFYREHEVTAVCSDELYARCEVISIHLAATNDTRGLYDAATLAKLRPDCVLVNTARGDIVDEIALREHLKAGRIAAAAFDVFSLEPPQDDALLNLENFIATPHLGASAIEARLQMGEAAMDGLIRNFLPEPGVYPFDHDTLHSNPV